MAFVERADDAQRFGIGELNATGQILNFTEKPQHPRSRLASMSVYVFRCDVLIEEIRRAGLGQDGGATFQIHEVLRRMMSRRRAYGWIHHGEWAYTRTLDEYHAFHRDLLGGSPRLDLDTWRVRTNTVARRPAPPPPARCLPGSRVEDALLAAGCIIGGSVRRSVLSPDVVVGEGADVEDSVLWDGVVVEPGAVLRGVISDKRVVFGRGCRVGEGEPRPSAELPASLSGGSVVVGMDARIPAGARIGRNCILHPEVVERDLASPVPSGASVRPAGRAGGAA
jgi:glucose-1-phosphate adenylyltransferase